MSDDIHPPHVLDDSPITIPREQVAADFRQRFEQAAKEFRALPPDGVILDIRNGRDADGKPCEIVYGVRQSETRLKRQCGRWLIQARDAGLIPPTYRELLDLIGWHAVTDQQAELDGRQAVMLRCPENLFLDVCGGHYVTGTFRGVDELGRVIFDDQKEGGGLMPRQMPGHLERPELDRLAATCEWLATVITEGGNQRLA